MNKYVDDRINISTSARINIGTSVGMSTVTVADVVMIIK